MDTSVITDEMEGRQLRFCDQPFKTMLVYWNGDVGLCCWDYDNFLKIGNVAESGLLDVYNNDKFRAVRDATRVLVVYES